MWPANGLRGVYSTTHAQWRKANRTARARLLHNAKIVAQGVSQRPQEFKVLGPFPPVKNAPVICPICHGVVPPGGCIHSDRELRAFSRTEM